MRRSSPLLALSIALLLAYGCASAKPRTAGSTYQRGVASWYGPGFHGRYTASGERYDMEAMTAAHPTLPFGTLVEVRNLDNGLATTVRINDRGPFKKNRIIDLSRAAARAIGMLGPGTARVELVAVGVQPPGPGAFAVQVGAFREAERARELSARLRGDYPGVEVRSDTVWHRVQVGHFESRGAAETVERELRALGYGAIVVPLGATP
ncbi:MAG: septal ring lytic transglycosylase RlpA family protein [Acidobacteria bacterium]|nr:septal ring lytic transglycosylase RlpA family protein [Acidobacteriota bacterium]MCB9378412.1 septal ring lytic transglycosylase RlpA family protein [Holophagales bacterium]